MEYDLMRKGLRSPLKGLRALRLLIRGQYYKWKYKLLRKNVTIGENFKVRAKLNIRGPGRVSIGDNVLVDGTSHAVTPWTA
ncbi:MAG: hypothetical protein RRA35_14280, partial [Desulfomonilia bacterium]|nr:hypothetical protein [Desulfomonilia bacterium]